MVRESMMDIYLTWGTVCFQRPIRLRTGNITYVGQHLMAEDRVVLARVSNTLNMFVIVDPLHDDGLNNRSTVIGLVTMCLVVPVDI